MAVIVSDGTLLHYLILIGQDSILQQLYGRIIVPPAVIQELSHPSAPREIFAWAKSPPVWLSIQMPQFIPPDFESLDFGERQALALAKEIKAELILLDDKAARRRAVGNLLK